MEKLQKNLLKIVPAVIIVIILLVAAFNSFYMLENKENAVVLRFGRVHTVVEEPGLHFKVPFVDVVEKVDVRSIRSMEYGFRTHQGGTKTSAAQATEFPDESTVIVDGNNNNASIALIELIIEYTVNNPKEYLFKVDDVEGTLRLALEDVVRSSCQSLTLDQAKTEKEIINAEVLRLLQEKINEYEVGIHIGLVATRNVQFLPSVEIAYQQKENANQYKNGKNEDAEKYANTVLPQANAEAVKISEDAYAYKAETISQANAAVAQFNTLYEEYLNYPDIVKEKYYLDAMASFFVNNKVIIDTTDDGSLYKFYNVDDSAIKQNIVETRGE